MQFDTTNSPALISINLIGQGSSQYKSIGNVSWNDIPRFAVLTGPNGTGKTQFLQALAYKLSYPRKNNPRIPEVNSLELQITGDVIAEHQIAYLPNSENEFRVEGSSIGSIHNAKQSFLSQLAPQNTTGQIEKEILRARIERQFSIKINSQTIPPEMAEKLPDDFTYMLDYNDVSTKLSHVFMGYQVRRAEKLMSGLSETQASEQIGRPPWEFVNDILSLTEFEYRVVPPENKLMQDYHVRVKSSLRNTKILELNDLSSGEKTILRTILWFYNSKHNKIFPKLFLLDEPDAHLHPSMTGMFIDVLNGVLVAQYGVRIIVTTHSPSTVALSPEGSVFVMSREQPRIRPAASQAEAIGLLTSGLVVVSRGTKLVFVEDEGDKTFCEMIRDMLSDQGPNKDRMALAPAPSLIFVAASIGRSKEKVPGGKTVVSQWVEKFDGPPLREIFRGLLDLDSGNTPTDRILVLGRYSIENYELDPFVIFGLLVDEGRSPNIHDISIAQGDEHLVRALDVSALQRVVEYVAKQIEPTLPSLASSEKELIDVEFTIGKTLKYPAWMLFRRGHDLLPAYQRVFGQMVVTPPKLLKAFRRVRMIPVELAGTMARLQLS